MSRITPRRAAGRFLNANGDFGRYAQHAIRKRPRLAHQHVAFIGLELLPAGRILPAHLDIPAHHTRTASAACSGRTFVRKIETLPQAGIEQCFLVAAIEGARAKLALDRYLHLRDHGLT